MMALVDNHVPVGGDEVVHFITANETLDHCDVQSPVGLALPSTDLSDLAGLEIEKQGELRAPLIEELRSMDEHESRPRALGDQVRPDDRLSSPGRRHEDADVMCEEGANDILLQVGQAAV